MARKSRDPFEVRLNDSDKQELAVWLSTELQQALDARTVSDPDVEYFHQLYEQGRTRLSQNMPWPDAADLTSPLGTEKVDALHARLLKTIMVSPVWSVEGWGDAAEKAPFVEEFHQWQVESEGLQKYLDETWLLALIEGRGVLEVYEDTLTRPIQKTIKAKLQLAEDGTPIIGEDLQPVYEVGPDGKYAEATDQTTPQAELVVKSTEKVRNGPAYRIIPSRDYLVLPAHVTDKADVFGRAKRFYRSVAQLQERAKQGLYDPEAVEEIGSESERASDTTLAGSAKPVAPQVGPTAEKELWEVQFLYDMDGSGELRWYVATVHVGKRVILRLQHDDVGEPRFVVFVPFPKPLTIEQGYSLIGNKLITVVEEDTAVRNMFADRAALALGAPVKRIEGALWDPQEVPWGPKAVIDVRDMREIEPVQVPDVPQSVLEWKRDLKESAERMTGLSDMVSSGLRPEGSRTLGEITLRTEQSYVRMEAIIKRMQEPMEDLAAIRHEIWKRTLQERKDGMPVPDSMKVGLESRGVNILEVMPDSKVTADMLEGAFRFKPYGSIETADPARNKQNFAQGLQALAMVMKMSPMVAAYIQTPEGAKTLYETWIQLFRPNNRKGMLGAMNQAAQIQAQQQAQQQQMAAQAAQLGAQPGGQPGAMPAGGPVGPPPPSGPPALIPGGQIG